MDTLSLIFLFIGISGTLLYFSCGIIIKIDGNMTDREISYFCDLIGIRYNTWYHPVCRRLSKEHYTFAVNLDKSKFFFYLCEVVGFQLALFKTCVLPIDFNLIGILDGLCAELIMLMGAVPLFFVFHDSHEENLRHQKEFV